MIAQASVSLQKNIFCVFAAWRLAVIYSIARYNFDVRRSDLDVSSRAGADHDVDEVLRDA